MVGGESLGLQWMMRSDDDEWIHDDRHDESEVGWLLLIMVLVVAV